MRAYSASKSYGSTSSVLGLGDGPQCEVDLDRLDRRAAHRLDELIGLLAGGREPLAEVDALGLELLDGGLDPLIQVGVDHRFGGLDVDERGERLVERPHEALAGLVELGLGERLAQAGVPLLDGVELAEVVGHPLVGELGGGHLLDGGDLDHEVGRFVGALGRGGERQLVAGGCADELVVEVVGDPALADLVGPVLGVEAHDLFAVAGGGEVERDEVAGLRSGGRRRRATRRA